MFRNWLGTELPATLRYVASFCAKPKNSAAPSAPNGVQRPKISAARAMKPAPAVMFLLKLPVATSVK